MENQEKNSHNTGQDKARTIQQAAKIVIWTYENNYNQQLA